jgi:hypothetical protein
MLTAARSRSPQRWPVWLLFAAWICANGPQMACFEVVVWLKGAGHFSHSHRLAASAAAALEGRDGDTLRWAEAQPASPPIAIPAEATMKKIELVAPDVRAPWGIVRRETRRGWGSPDPGMAIVADVPHPPPRDEV